jgi:hypothetical protein
MKFVKSPVETSISRERYQKGRSEAGNAAAEILKLALKPICIQYQ